MVSDDTFRMVTGQFATGVTVVTLDAGGRQHGMTANSFASLSIDPPLVLFNADVDTNCHELVPEAEHFAINILTADQEWLSNRFAGEHHEMDDPFEDVEYTTRATGAPIVENTLGFLDCSLWAAYDGGDHTIYVGEVEDLGILDGDADPLTFFRGDYGTIE
jgi:flavin reductase (DIM6/NTAB) family NADH-FMN oxidoreductase RutF